MEWKAAGNAPRTEFKITTSQADSDYQNTNASELLEGVAQNHFAQYEAMSEKYPDVSVIISVGGWTRCGYFSEMAYTKEGRASFIQSCMDMLEQDSENFAALLSELREAIKEKYGDENAKMLTTCAAIENLNGMALPQDTVA